MKSVKCISQFIVTIFLMAIPLMTFSPPAHADCSNIEVIFARGTFEGPGVGTVGQEFVSALQSRVGPVAVYGVNYPASLDFTGSVVAGVGDTAAHLQMVVVNCPNTEIILGGFSQGAAVAAFTTSDAVPDGVDTTLQPMSSRVSSHVAAVVVFGLPGPSFSAQWGVPAAGIGSNYSWKADIVCAPGDPVCGDGGNMDAHNAYQADGLIDQGAQYAASRL